MVCLQLHATPITDLRDLVSASGTLTRRNPPVFFLNDLRRTSNFPVVRSFREASVLELFPDTLDRTILERNSSKHSTVRILSHGRSLVESVKLSEMKSNGGRIPLLFVRSTSPNVASL